MDNNKQIFASRGAWVSVIIVLILALAACGGRGQEPELVIPTPAGTAVVPTVQGSIVLTPTSTPASPPPTTTLPPPPTVAPPLPTTGAQATATAQPTATATVAPTATPVATVVPVGETAYRVAFVTADDMLNVRRRPNADAAVVTQLAPGTTGIRAIDEGQPAIGGNALWLPVETSAGDGWVNSRFLTEDVSHEAFCGDPAVTELLSRFQTAVADEDGRLLRELVHPDRGLRVRLNWWNDEVFFAGEDVQTIFRAQKKQDWGIEDGSGEPIRGSFSEVAMPRLERDLLGASQWNCDQGQFGPTAGLTNLPAGYEAVRYYSAHRPAPAEQELDWGTWLVGVEHWQGRYYVSYLVHYRWEI